MVALPQTYNTADLPDTGGGMPLIPPGQYQAVIINSELVENKNRNGHYLALKIAITQGPHAHTEFTERLNIINPNSQAVEIAYKTLARISEAVGMTQTPQDSVQLHNKPLIIEVATEIGTPYTDNQGETKQGKDKSIIKKYLPIPGQAAFASSNSGFVQQQASAPSFLQQAQQSQQQTPLANPFAPPPRS